jgi:hypothetical protein
MILALWAIFVLNFIVGLFAARGASDTTVRLIRIELTIWFVTAILYGAVA